MARYLKEKIEYIVKLESLECLCKNVRTAHQTFWYLNIDIVIFYNKKYSFFSLKGNLL